MGLDIYVGSLTRYHAGDWETIVQRTAREAGMGMQVIRANPDPPDKITDKAVINQAVHQWMQGLSVGLAKHMNTPLEWDERADSPYFTDKPDWVGYAGVVLFAAYHEHPTLPRPEKAISHWDKDPAWQASTTPGFRSRFGQLLTPEYWLPMAFPFTFKAVDVVGNEATFGSSTILLQQLTTLNADTFQGTDDDLARWKYEGAGSRDSFEESAQFGLAMFAHHARLSVQHKLPMKLDY